MRKKSGRGLTLVEVVLALGVLAIIAAPLLGALSSGLEAAKSNERRLTAQYAAALRYEELRGLSAAELQAEAVRGPLAAAGSGLVTSVELEQAGPLDCFKLTVSACDEVSGDVLYRMEGVLYAPRS